MVRAKARSAMTQARLSKSRLAEMIEEATVDAYDESEQATGWFTMFEDHLELPFETKVLGAVVTVARIDLRDGGEIVAICTRAAANGKRSRWWTSRCRRRGRPVPIGSRHTGTGWVEEDERPCGEQRARAFFVAKFLPFSCGKVC